MIYRFKLSNRQLRYFLSDQEDDELFLGFTQIYTFEIYEIDMRQNSENFANHFMSPVLYIRGEGFHNFGS